MYNVHMWCAVFSSCLYISLSCILSVLFLFTLRDFFDLSIRCEQGFRKSIVYNWSSVFVCLPLSLSPHCSLWYVQPERMFCFQAMSLCEWSESGEPIPKRKSTRWRISLPFGGGRIITVDSTLANNANISQLGWNHHGEDDLVYLICLPWVISRFDYHWPGFHWGIFYVLP